MAVQLTIAPPPDTTTGFTLEVTHADGVVVLSHSPWGGEAIDDFITARRAARALMAADDVVGVLIRPILDVLEDPAYRPTI